MQTIQAPLVDRTVALKVERLRAGASPRILDLFAGCGGLSLGFDRAGFSICGAVEIDPDAAASHALNFAERHEVADFDRHSTPRDITTIEPGDLAASLELASVSDSIDVIVGGPPCQAFARVGRAKLREVAEHPEAFLQDHRSNLYLRYLHYVNHFQPLVVLIENVPDILNYGGHNVSEEMCEVLEAMGYRANYTLLNAAYFGVPQMRERMFLLAYHEATGRKPRFPAPTHWVDLPRGYEGSRQVALKSLETNLFQQDSHYVAPATATRRLPAAVTAREALQDLPRLTDHLNGGSRRGTRHFDTFATYRPVTPTSYAKAMREWPGFEANGVFDHVIRHLPRDYNLFRVMNAGDQYPQAYQHALRLFEARLSECERETGLRLSPDSAAYRELQKSIVPPYDAGKFPNKWRKMESDAPARTLMAHLGKDSYSHIHYDSEQARTISVREAARLQSFPDGFRFHGKMNSAFRQIGNAVPPLLANAIARVVREALNLKVDAH